MPGAGYAFGQLQLALALGDFEALKSRQKLALRHILHGAWSMVWLRPSGSFSRLWETLASAPPISARAGFGG
jgi:hypothetical protein